MTTTLVQAQGASNQNAFLNSTQISAILAGSYWGTVWEAASAATKEMAICSVPAMLNLLAFSHPRLRNYSPFNVPNEITNLVYAFSPDSTSTTTILYTSLALEQHEAVGGTVLIDEPYSTYRGRGGTIKAYTYSTTGLNTIELDAALPTSPAGLQCLFVSALPPNVQRAIAIQCAHLCLAPRHELAQAAHQGRTSESGGAGTTGSITNVGAARMVWHVEAHNLLRPFLCTAIRTGRA